MKKTVIFSALFLLITAFAHTGQAQDKLKLELGMNTGMPIGDFSDFMGKNSFRGFHGDLMYPLSERWQIGLGVSFNDYYEKHPRQIYNTKDGIISAVVSNSLQTTPILFKASYDLTNEGLIRPYAGVGAGVNMVSYAQYLGEFGDRTTSFKLAVAADAGIRIPFDRETRSSGINLGGNFNYMPYNKNGLKTLNNWGIHLGVFFPLR